MMSVTLNGEQRSVAATVVADLVAHLQLTGRFALERNGEIVPRSRYAETPLAEGDRIEIVHAIGGG